MTVAIIKKEVYRFDQLEKNIRDKLVSSNKEEDSMFINGDIEEKFTSMLEEAHLPGYQVRYSLSYSQGDGCCIDGGPMKYDENHFAPLMKELLKNTKYERKIKLIEEMFMNDHFTIDIYHNQSSRYCHEKTMSISLDCREIKQDRHNHLENMFATIEKCLISYCEKLCIEMKKVGYEILESYDEDYYFQHFKDEEVFFTPNGEIVDHSEIENLLEVKKELYGK